MYDHVLRGPKQTLFLPLAKRVSVSPNVVTGVGFVFGLAAAVAVCFGLQLTALIFWLVNRFLDGLDGEVARVQNRQSDLGGYLDILADLVVYAFLPIGIAIHSPSHTTWFLLALMLASFYLNVGSWMYLSSLLEKRGQGAEQTGESTSVAMPRGLIEGGETIIFFTLFLLLPHSVNLLFASFAALTLMGAGLRVRWAAQILGHPACG